MFGNFVSSMAGVAAGNVIGHGISHSLGLTGHGSNNRDEAAPAAAQAAPAAAAAPAAEQMAMKGQGQRGPCWAYQESLYKCMENNSELSRCVRPLSWPSRAVS